LKLCDVPKNLIAAQLPRSWVLTYVHNRAAVAALFESIWGRLMNVVLQRAQKADTGAQTPRAWRLFVLSMVAVLTAVLMPPDAVAQEPPTPAVKAKAAKAKASDASKAAEGGEAAGQKTAVKRDPALAQRSFESGVKLLQAGKAEQAIQTFSGIISGGHVPPQLMARALHQRGVGYRAAGKPALAVSDLTSALWLKGGLTDTERADAVQHRTAAYREAGLPDQSDPGEAKAATKRLATAPAAAGAISAPQTAQQPPVTTASLAPETARPAEQTTSPIGSFFGNLFGGGASNTTAAAVPVAAAVPQTPPPPATSGWSSATVPVPGATKAAREPAAATATRAAAVVTPPAAPVAAAPTPAKATTAGSIHARMIARSEAEANSLAGRLKSEFGGQMGGRSPSVSQAQFGSMGSFFQVRVGPYKTPAEAQEFCGRIKSTGADCVAVGQ
jgi:SPOR domain